MDNEIQTTNQNTEVASFEKIETAITEVVTAINAATFNVMNPKGLNQAIEARAQIKALRINLGKAGKAAKAALNIEKRRVDTEVTRLTDLALTGEEPLHKLIKDRQDVLAEEKRKRDEAEANRKTKIQSTIHAISALPAKCHGKASGEINGVIEYVEAYEITGFFEEFTEQAENAKATAIAEIKSILDSVLQREQEDAERKAEAERLAEQKREQDERQAVLDAEQAEIDRKKAEQEEADRKKSEEEAASIEDAKQEESAETPIIAGRTKAFPDVPVGEPTEEPMPAVPASPDSDNEPEWVPVVRRLKKDVLGDILATAVSAGLSDADSLERIVSICKANLRTAK